MFHVETASPVISPLDMFFFSYLTGCMPPHEGGITQRVPKILV
jgi:hypothetical protein